MTDVGLHQRPLVPTVYENALRWLHFLVSGYCLLFGVLYWIRLLGVYDGSLWRFDLMPVHWQVTAVTLAVFYPVAAIGLWMMASWGPVIWAICAVTEIIMYGGFPDLFGYRWMIIASHLSVAIAYAALRVAVYLQKRPR